MLFFFDFALFFFETRLGFLAFLFGILLLFSFFLSLFFSSSTFDFVLFFLYFGIRLTDQARKQIASIIATLACVFRNTRSRFADTGDFLYLIIAYDIGGL